MVYCKFSNIAPKFFVYGSTTAERTMFIKTCLHKEAGFYLEFSLFYNYNW